MKKKMILFALLIHSYIAYPQVSENNDNLLQQGINAILAGENEEAIEIFKKCIASEENNPDKTDCLTNLGRLYEQQEEYSLALDSYQEALEIFAAGADEENMAVIYNEIGQVQISLANYEQSIRNFTEALKLAEKLENNYLKAKNLSQIGKVNGLQGNNFGGVEFFQRANKIAREINSQELIVETLGGIAGIYEKIFFYKDALVYRGQYLEELENFREFQRIAELKEIRAAYDLAAQEDRAIILEQQKQLETIKKKGSVNSLDTIKGSSPTNFVATFSAVVIAFLAVGFYYKRDLKTRKKLSLLQATGKTEEQERLRISKGIHDDLRSGLTRINMLSEMIFQKTSHLPDVKSNSVAVRETAKKMFESTWDLIWALNPENTSIGNLISRMKEFAKDYLNESDIEPVFHIPEQLPETIITKESHTELYLVVKESLNNIASHAAASKVFFTANLHRDILLITIIDNGNGFIVGSENAGTGLKNMSKRLQNLGGVWEVTSKIGQGTMISISISLDLIKSNKKRSA